VPEESVVEKEQVKSLGKGSSIVKMLLVVVLALVSSASGGVVTWLLISKTMAANATPTEKEEKAAEEDKMAELLENSAVLPLEPFIVNLADEEAARYLRIKITLLVDDKTKSKELEENQALQLKVRDVILQSLTGKTSKDLINEDGKNKLRREIQEKISVYFREPKLVDVMFTEFVIQL
jgi:flagellar protein FliL